MTKNENKPQKAESARQLHSRTMAQANSRDDEAGWRFAPGTEERNGTMQINEIMSDEPECCTPDTSICEAAQMMSDFDCGAIPVIEATNGKRPIGIITDRDIACRAVARGLDPIRTKVRDCMSSPLATISVNASVDACCKVMEERQVRRLLAVDAEGRIAGIIAQADIALRLPAKKAAEVVREVSQPSEHAAVMG
jgi:CBS domain-containing protein